MTFTDYLLNGALVALVLLQIRGRRLTPRMLLFPVGIVAFAAVEYLHGIPTSGNDLLFEIGGVLLGALLGIACGLATRVYANSDGEPFAKAGLLAAGLWIIGVGARIGFSIYATNGGGSAIERFSAAHGITSMEAWVACLILMSIVEVLSRNGILALRRYGLIARGEAAPGVRLPRPAGAVMMDTGDHWS
jgi:hypothetical protein